MRPQLKRDPLDGNQRFCRGLGLTSIVDALKQLFSRQQRAGESTVPVTGDDDLRWLHPPASLLDPTAWDQYWSDQLAHGFGPPLFDMFCDDRLLVQAMADHRMTTILCAGNGMSMEPRALAAAGFDVVALDLSPRALQIARAFPPSDDLLTTFLEPASRRPGGRVEYVAGSILDPTVCPGPFDVIIERRTVQSYPDAERVHLLTALAARLSPDGIFLSHCHDGGWRPPAKRRHVTSEWFREQGWPLWAGVGTKPEGRVAWLFTSTG